MMAKHRKQFQTKISLRVPLVYITGQMKVVCTTMNEYQMTKTPCRSCTKKKDRATTYAMAL